MLELNSIAPNYTVTQVDFDFYDDEATIILKQEAVKDIGKIYALSEKTVRQRRIEFENFLIYNQDWRKYSEKSTFEEMYKGVDALEQSLLKMRFTDLRTLQKMQDIGLSTEYYLAYTPEDMEEVILPGSVWDDVKKLAFPDNVISSGAADFIIDYFRSKPWKIQEDLSASSIFQPKNSSKCS